MTSRKGKAKGKKSKPRTRRISRNFYVKLRVYIEPVALYKGIIGPYADVSITIRKDRNNGVYPAEINIERKRIGAEAGEEVVKHTYKVVLQPNDKIGPFIVADLRRRAIGAVYSTRDEMRETADKHKKRVHFAERNDNRRSISYDNSGNKKYAYYTYTFSGAVRGVVLERSIHYIPSDDDYTGDFGVAIDADVKTLVLMSQKVLYTRRDGKKAYRRSKRKKERVEVKSTLTSISDKAQERLEKMIPAKLTLKNLRRLRFPPKLAMYDVLVSILELAKKQGLQLDDDALENLNFLIDAFYFDKYIKEIDEAKKNGLIPRALIEKWLKKLDKKRRVFSSPYYYNMIDAPVRRDDHITI